MLHVYESSYYESTVEFPVFAAGITLFYVSRFHEDIIQELFCAPITLFHTYFSLPLYYRYQLPLRAALS
jgi:hypothetical protein